MLIKSIIDFFLPPRCFTCSQLTGNQEGFCSKCWLSLNFITKPYCMICGKGFSISALETSMCGKCIQRKPIFKLSRSLLKFDEVSKKLIHAFKYHDKTNLAKTFAQLLISRYKNEIDEIDCIVPVPMNRFKRLFRNYNQAHILAIEIGRLLKKPVLGGVLTKLIWSKPQTFLNKAERMKNIQGTISISTKEEIRHRKILLVDDVLTTGTTITECSKILKHSGAKEVSVLTIAST